MIAHYQHQISFIVSKINYIFIKNNGQIIWNSCINTIRMIIVIFL